MPFVQCGGKKKDGTQCRGGAVPGSHPPRCGPHLADISATRPRRNQRSAPPAVAEDDDEDPTPEEIARVRRLECRQRGHIWNAVEVVGYQDPVGFICSNCGREIAVASPR